MKYSVTGADKETGDERTIIISATDTQDAERQARRLGLLISSITPRGQVEPPQSASAAMVKSASLNAAAVAINAPDYAALQTMARVFFVFACMAYALTLILLGAVALLTYERIKGQEPSLVLSSFEYAVDALGVLLVGIFNHGISVFFVAFRDLVRNSFR
jgi:hypothetical protein